MTLLDFGDGCCNVIAHTLMQWEDGTPVDEIDNAGALAALESIRRLLRAQLALRAVPLSSAPQDDPQ